MDALLTAAKPRTPAGTARQSPATTAPACRGPVDDLALDLDAFDLASNLADQLVEQFLCCPL